MYFSDYLALCESDDLKPYNLLSSIELKMAKGRAIEIRDGKKRLAELDGKLSPITEIAMQDWLAQQDEKRVGHMLNALDYAESMNEVDARWNDKLKGLWQAHGMDLPKL